MNSNNENNDYLISLDEDKKLSDLKEDIESQIKPLYVHMIKYVNQQDKQGSKWIDGVVNAHDNIMRKLKTTSNNAKRSLEKYFNDEKLDSIYKDAIKEAEKQMHQDVYNTERDTALDYKFITNPEEIHKWFINNLNDKPFNSAIDYMNKDTKYKKIMGTTAMESDGIYNDINGKKHIVRMNKC